MDLLTQAKEDLQRDRMIQTFNTILPWALGALVVVLVGVGVREGYTAYQNHQHRKYTDAYISASLDPSSLTALEKVAKEDGSERGVMAGLTAFARMSPQEQETQGIPLLKSMADDKSLPADWRALAALVMVKAQIAFGADAAKADALLTSLKPATDDKDNTWHGLSSVQAALISGEMKQDPKAALSYVEGFDGSKLSPQLGGEIAKLQSHYGALVNTKE